VVEGSVSDVAAAFREGGLSGAIAEFKAQWPELVSGIEEAVGPLAEKVKAWLASIPGAIVAWAQENGATVGATILSALTTIVDTYLDFVELAVNLGGKLLAWVGSAIDWLADQIPGLTARLCEKLDALLNGTADAAGEGSDVFKGWVKRFGGIMVALVGNAIQFIFQNILPLAGAILTAVGQIWETFVQAAYDNLPRWSGNFGALLGTALGAALKFLTDTLPVYVAQFIGWLSSLFTDTGTEAERKRSEWGKVLLQAISSAWNAFKEALTANGPPWVEDFFQWIDSSIQGVVDKITATKDFFARFWAIGAGIVEGIKQGIENAKDMLKQFIMDFLGKIMPDWAEKALGMESPSRVFAEIGKGAALGLGLGWQKALPGVARDMAGSLAGLGDLGVGLGGRRTVAPAAITVDGWVRTIGDGGAQAGDLFARSFADSALRSPGMRRFAENLVALLMTEMAEYVERKT